MSGSATSLAAGVIGLGAMGAGIAQSLRRASKFFPGIDLPEKKP